MHFLFFSVTLYIYLFWQLSYLLVQVSLSLCVDRKWHWYTDFLSIYWVIWVGTVCFLTQLFFGVSFGLLYTYRYNFPLQFLNRGFWSNHFKCQMLVTCIHIRLISTSFFVSLNFIIPLFAFGTSINLLNSMLLTDGSVAAITEF